MPAIIIVGISFVYKSQNIMLFNYKMYFEGKNRNYIIRIGREAHDIYFITIAFNKHFVRIPLILDTHEMVKTIDMLNALRLRQYMPFNTFVATIAGCARIAMQHRDKI